MTKGTFGDNLRREREMRGVSLDEISAATRIATRFLQAIENEEWSQLPGGVFNRGFVLAVAHYLGLDEENTVAEYALAVDDRPTVPVWTGRPPAVVPDRQWLALILAAIAVVAIVAGGWFGTRRILAWRSARREARSAVLSTAPAPTVPATPADSGTDTTKDATPGFPPSSTPAVAPTDAAVSVPPEAIPAVLSATAETAPMELKIETVKKTKVTIEADKSRVFEGTVQAGENRTFSAKDRFQISARDAGALVIQLNGKTLAPIGPLGHSGKVTLTREALKGATGGQN
jgi:cytoskeletal protein RodZ